MISEVKLFGYRLPLAKPLPSRSHEIISRDGLLVMLKSEIGTIGWGEIAPLPGFSQESFEQGRSQALSVLTGLRGTPVPAAYAEAVSLAESIDSDQLLPSVRCGFEMALLNMAASGSRVPVRRLLNADTRDSVPLNGLLAGSVEEVKERASALVDKGYRSLKLKVGSAEIATDIAKVKIIRETIPSEISLRLDANRAWSLDTAVRLGMEARKYDIEYIEEPVCESNELESFYRATGVSYALDESIREMTTESLNPRPGLRAIVLKPTLLGSIFRAIRLARQAQEVGVLPVVSSSFESAIGIALLAEIAAAISPNTPCGLDTGDWFRTDLLQPPAVIEDGCLHLRSAGSDCAVNTYPLTEIAAL